MIQKKQKIYEDILKVRKKIIISLLFLIVLPYFSFISIIAFKPIYFGRLIEGYSISSGVIVGFVLILHIFVITFLYAFLANKKIEPLVKRLTFLGVK